MRIADDTCYYLGMDNNDDLMSTKQAAAALGVSVGRIRQLLISGALPSIKPGHDRLVRRGDVDALRTRKTKPGPPARKPPPAP